MKLWKKIAVGALLALGAMQFVRFERTNPPVTADIRVAADVKSVLRRACYDCHSNETVWPTYSQIAPVSWLLHRDVIVGREELNFSSWESLPPEKRAKKTKKIGKEVADGEMPPWFYTPLHPQASLSAADKQLLQSWVQGAPETPPAPRSPSP
jgi:cytochrome c551/c552